MQASCIGCPCSTMLFSRCSAILATPGPSAVCRTHTSKHPDGSLHIETLPQEQWLFLIQEVHVGYLSWEDYEANLAQLRANRQARGEDRRHGPPREGPALLQGLLICGRCGNRMTVGYHDVKKGQRLYPEYRCQKEYVEEGDDKCCQRLLGAGLDTVIADLLLAQLTPLAIETSLQIHEELHAQVQEASRLRAQQVERARLSRRTGAAPLFTGRSRESFGR